MDGKYLGAAYWKDISKRRSHNCFRGVHGEFPTKQLFKGYLQDQGFEDDA